jgi:hypothetical protein
MPAGTVRTGLVVITVLIVLVTTAGCSEMALAPGEEELEDTGPDMSFWVELDILHDIAANYETVRVLVWDESKQVGRVSNSGANKYRITLPESYSEKSVTYVAEFTKKESNINVDHYEFSNESIKPLIIGLLRSRYSEFGGNIPDKETTVAKLFASPIEIKIANLILGFGPGSLKLDDIEGAPHIYLINLDTSDISGSGLTVTLGIAMKEGVTPISGSDLDLDSALGIASPETDWILLLAPEYEPGTSLTFWFIMERAPNDAGCLCGSFDDGCNCELSCLYKITNAPPLTVTKTVGDVRPETGSTIGIKFEVDDLSCSSLLFP